MGITWTLLSASWAAQSRDLPFLTLSVELMTTESFAPHLPANFRTSEKWKSPHLRPLFFIFSRTLTPNHEAAYLEYLHSLGWDCITKKSLRRRWKAYRGEYFDDLEDQQYRLAHFISESGEEERQKRDEAILLIENLIA